MSWWNHSWKGQCINSEIPSHSWSIFGDRIISLAADQTRSYRVHLVKAFDLSEILWSLRHKRIQKPPNNPLVQLSHAYPIQSTVVSNCEAVSQSSNYVIVNLCSFFSSSASFQPAKSLPSEAVYASLVHKISGSFSLNAVFIQVFLVALSPRLRISPCGCLSWSLLCSSRIESRCRFFYQYLIWGE
jgi:hypothetical protein